MNSYHSDTAQSLTIPGILLVPGFSVYLLEVIVGGEKWYYIGMTGDNYYPSARSAFHRLSAHLELLSRSTQNQLMRALKTQVFKKDTLTTDDLVQLTLRMHHFPQEGYTMWPGAGMSKAELNNHKDAHDAYLNARKKIAEAEVCLICEFKGRIKDRLLNRDVKVKQGAGSLYNDLLTKMENVIDQPDKL